jgi:hypothetical protein
MPMSDQEIFSNQNWIAYMDESGFAKDPDVQFVCMGGLITKAVRWEIFKVEWQKALDDFDIPNLHMRQFYYSKGPYEKWKNDKVQQQRVMTRFMDIIRNANAVPFGSIVFMDDYRNLTLEQQKQLGNPYQICFQDISQFAVHVTEYLSPYERSSRIEMIFDDNKLFRTRAKELWGIIQREARDGRRMEKYNFADMRKELPLQAADIVAYHLNKRYKDKSEDIRKKMRWAYEQLNDIAVKNKFYIWRSEKDEKELKLVLESFKTAGKKKHQQIQ